MAAAIQNPTGILSCTSCIGPLENISDAITSVVSCETIQRVALGALAFLVAFPIAALTEHFVVDLMVRWGFDLSPSQDIMAIWTAAACFPSPLNIILLVALVAYIVIIGPILEEFVFRHLLHGCLEGVTDSPVLRALANGVIFGAAHLSTAQGWKNVPIFLVTSLLGVVNSALREATGDIVSSSTAHILHNGTVMGFFLLK